MHGVIVHGMNSQWYEKSCDRPKHITHKVKVIWVYLAPSRETSKALRHGSQITTPCLALCLVSVHQMALSLTVVTDI